VKQRLATTTTSKPNGFFMDNASSSGQGRSNATEEFIVADELRLVQ
jgi:hypothetical protein